MKLKFLFEEYRDSIKVEKNTYPIYTNPDRKDFVSMKKDEETEEFRYIVRLYGKPVIYVFDSRVLHFEAAKKLGIEYRARRHLPVWGDYAFGISKYDNKLELDRGIITEVKRMGKRAPIAFLKRYFNNI